MRIPEASLAADLAHALDRRGISFMLVGAAALAIRGLSRGTHDVDFMTLDPGVLQLDWSEDLSGDTVIEPRLDDLDDPLAGVVTFSREGSTDVDLVVARWKWQQQVIDRSEPTDLEVFTVRVPDVEDLVLLKIEAGGFLDQRDAAQLIEIHGPEVIGRVDRRVLDLPEPMQRAWQRVRDEILER